MKTPVLFLFLFLATHLSSLADNAKVFTLEDFYFYIMENHPVARQAYLLSDQARQELRVARGLFDPTINSRLYKKELDGTNYFTLWDNTLRIPVWYGTDIKAGFERNSGVNVNGENYTPTSGLSYLGISIPLGQGLIIDQRRATLRQAQLLGDLAEAERISIINKLLLQATKDYWDWLYTFNKLNLHEEAYELAAFRFEAVKRRAIEGDLSYIDTVEAKIEVQNRSVMLQQSIVDYQNSSLILSNHLWGSDDSPLEITDDVVPDTTIAEDEVINRAELEELIASAKTNHPDLLKLKVKKEQLGIERKFLADRLKPRVNLEYNVIQRGFPIEAQNMNNGFFSNNYKFGLGFNMPIFLRAERGKLQLNNLKVQELDLDIQQFGREIINQIQAYYNELVVLDQQINLQEEMLRNTQVLRNGEQQLFENGESSLFMINTREMALINNQLKLYELRMKYLKAKMTLQWAAGNVTI